MVMVRKLAVLAVVLSAAGVLADATQPGKVTVEGVEVQVTRQLDTKNYPTRTASTRLTVLVNCPGKQVLSVDPSSKVKELRDDKGTDLTKAAKARAGGLPLLGYTPTFTQAEIARDRSSVLASVFAGISPARGATRIHLKGDLVLVCGTGEKTTDARDLEIKMDAQAKLGEFTLKVTQTKGLLPGTGGSITVLSPAPTIKSVNIKATDGKPVEVTTGFSYGFGKNWTSTFLLKRAVQNVKVSITYFSRQEKVTVGVDTSLGLGL
jgi:hypothetical protein